MTKSVLVTGASGFIALHVVDELLARAYHVVGTVRSQAKADNLSTQFKAEYPDAKLEFEIVEDIAAPGAFDKALQNHPEVTEVLHTASPFSFGLNKDLKDAYFTPATQGTKNILEAVEAYAKQVKHVVITSSNAAIINKGKEGDKSFIHTEETWNPITWDDVTNEGLAYAASKKLAERLAQDFVVERKPSWTLTTVNPSLVFGPQKFESALANPTLNTSAETVNRLLSSNPEDTQALNTPIGTSIDVRDVAKLHVLPIEDDGLAGKRLYAIHEPYTAQVILNIINKNFPELDGKVAKGSPEGAEKYAEENTIYYDTTKTLEWSGLDQWTPLEKTIVDSVKQILDYKKKN